MAKSTRITELDFDQIKNNLKTYLQGQSEFKDYDFEGAGLNMLLDVLAYNTHYQSFYANMVSNEMFLDSAVLRDSVVSLAKHLGYTPRSTRAATATVDVKTSGVATNPGTLEEGAVFTSTKDNITYYFTSTNNVKYIDAGDGNFVAKGVIIKEGLRTSSSFIKNDQDLDQKFIIPSNTVDTTTLDVRVQTSITDQSGANKPWLLSSDFNALTSTSKVYFLQEVENGQFEVFFGDGIVGEGLSDGNLITISYISTNGSVANGIGNADKTTARTFTYVNAPTYDVAVTVAAIGGDAPESIDSIKYMAPRFYQSQNRAVTIEDYKTIMTSQFADIESVYIWGGEDNDPPVYGKVFISVKPLSGTLLSTGQKLSIQNELKRNQSMAGILPELVDPDFVYLNITSDVKFDPDQTSAGANTIANTIVEKVLNYGDTQLEKFERNLRYKTLLETIEDVNEAITKSETTILLEKRLVPILGSRNPYTLRFGNSLFNPHMGHSPILSSSNFSVVDAGGTTRTAAYLKDDGNGKVSTCYNDADGNVKVVVENQGTLDYNTGVLVLNDFQPTSAALETYISIKAEPRNKNIRGERNQILIIDRFTDSVNVTVTQETSYETSVGGTVGSTPQSFTSSVGTSATSATSATSSSTSASSSSASSSGASSDDSSSSNGGGGGSSSNGGGGGSSSSGGGGGGSSSSGGGGGGYGY